MKFYAYDAKQYGGTFNRYILTVTCNADIVDTGTSFAGYAFTTTLEWETYTTATDTWGGTTVLTGTTIASSTTVTNLTNAYDAIGIDVDPATGTVFFTDLDVSGAGDQINMNTSAWQPTGATPATGTLSRNKATGVNGATVFLAPSRLAVFQTDGILGNAARVMTYTTVANGTMTFVANVPISPYLIGRSVRFNAGNGGYYGLVSDPHNGISLAAFPDWTLANPIPLQLLFPPPPVAAQAVSTGITPYELDLMTLPTAGGPMSGAYPMVGLFGGTPYYISNQGSGLIPYVDLTGLSVADALQQLTVINAGIFYVVPSGWVFRSRSSPDPRPGMGIGVGISSDRIDNDFGMLSMTNQNVFNRWVGFVRIENENDAAIFGEAGDAAFAEMGQGLTLKSRFVSSKSFAAALATSLLNYIGARKRWIEVERLRDGRVYEVGRRFSCLVDGGVRNFQIIETGHPIAGVTVKVVGLEV
jgi:hypothetical protein